MCCRWDMQRDNTDESDDCYWLALHFRVWCIEFFPSILQRKYILVIKPFFVGSGLVAITKEWMRVEFYLCMYARVTKTYYYYFFFSEDCTVKPKYIYFFDKVKRDYWIECCKRLFEYYIYRWNLNVISFYISYTCKNTLCAQKHI